MGKAWKVDLDNMVYIIRDEGILPLKSLVGEYGEERVRRAQAGLLGNLVNLMEYTFPNATIKVANAMEQVEQAKLELGDTPTISLDAFFSGTYNLEITRLFKIENGETIFLDLTNRPDTPDIYSQIKCIKPGKYVLVDDDAVGGRTIQSVKKMLPSDAEITDIYLLMDSYRNKKTQPVLDVVDCRDFIAGCQGAGLTVLNETMGKLRAPYMYPFIDINDKANIPDEQCIEVSKQLWRYVSDFWATIDPTITLRDMGKDFRSLSELFKIPNTTPMIQVCEKYEVMAEKGMVKW